MGNISEVLTCMPTHSEQHNGYYHRGMKELGRGRGAHWGR